MSETSFIFIQAHLTEGKQIHTYLAHCINSKLLNIQMSKNISRLQLFVILLLICSAMLHKRVMRAI